MTPAIAPLAPMVGTTESGLLMRCEMPPKRPAVR
jgi:hypothetical protein